MDKPVYIGNYEHMGKVCWGNETMRRLFDTEEERLQKYPGAKYAWENEAFTYDNLSEEDPKLLKRMQEMHKRWPGRIQIGSSTYGQPLSFYIGGESNVRQLTEGIASDLQYFGQRPWIYIMSEHGMHAQIPQLVAQAGFRGAVMRTSFCMYGLNPEYPASCINWKGLDGVSSVPTVPTYPGEQCHCAVNGYTHDDRTLEFAFFGANTMDNKILLDYPVNAPWGGLEEFRDRFGGRIRNIVAFRDDDPRQPEGVIAEYHQKPGFTFVLDEDILKAAGEPEMDVQTGVNDFHVRMPWGFCGNWIWEKCRSTEYRLFALDELDAMRALVGASAHPELLRDAWKMLLICQHHDVQICGIEADARRFFGRGDRDLDTVEKDVLGETRTWRFNPLPWTRKDGGEEALSVAPVTKKAATGSSFDGQVLTTPFYSVTLSPAGGFDALLDRQNARSVFLPGRRSGLLAGSIDGVPHVAEGSWAYRPGSGKAELVETGHVGSVPYETTWTFYDDHDRVDCAVRIETDGQFIGRRSDDPKDAVSSFIHDEKLRMKFYPAMPGTAMGWRDQPYGAAASNRQSLECNLWAAVVDGDNGFAVLNRGISTLVREVDGAVSVPIAFSMYYRWSGCYTEGLPDGSDSDVNNAALYRNSVEDKYYRDEAILREQRGEPHTRLVSKHFLHGTYTGHLAILPFSGNWQSAQLHRRAYEYNAPCIDVSEETASLLRDLDLKLDLPENVFLSSLYHADGRAYVRLYEMGGGEGDVSVSLRGRRAGLTPVDFFHTPSGAAVSSARLGPWQVRTFRIEAE